MVFRRRKGGNIIAKQPTPRSSLPSQSERAFRAKFALTGKIASGINSVEVLKEIWPNSTGRASKFNQIFKANYAGVISASDPGTVAVAPSFGFDVVNAVLTAGATGIHLVTDMLGTNVDIDTSIEKYIVAGGIVVLQTPTSAGISANRVIAFKSIQHNLDLINPIDLAVNFTGEVLKQYQSYTTRNVFACLVTLDDAGKAIRYSTTVNS
jgi:hypothetical protein